ncbi:MAG: hypothetical protein V7K38_05740 [Nostoc sp.]
MDALAKPLQELVSLTEFIENSLDLREVKLAMPSALLLLTNA